MAILKPVIKVFLLPSLINFPFLDFSCWRKTAASSRVALIESQFSRVIAALSPNADELLELSMSNSWLILRQNSSDAWLLASF